MGRWAMIFAPENCDLILKGIKTTTRRPRLPSDVGVTIEDLRGRLWKSLKLPAEYLPTGCQPDRTVVAMRRNGRLLWAVDKTYAIKSKRTAKQIGRIKLLSIRLERVGDISKEDAFSEGVNLMGDRWGFVPTGPGREYIYTLNGRTFIEETAQKAYLEAWKSFYKKSDFTEEVWVLTFKVAI